MVVIGSGATAMTLVPAMAADCGARDDAAALADVRRHRGPTTDAVANGAAARSCPSALAYADHPPQERRPPAVLLQAAPAPQPDKVKAKLIGDGAQAARPRLRRRHALHPDATTRGTSGCAWFPTATSSRPSGEDRASVVTDDDRHVHRDRHAHSRSGAEARGRHRRHRHRPAARHARRDADFVVDGEPVDFSTTWTYKGFAYSDVPNLASSFGYINASWTLRADLTCALRHAGCSTTCDATGTVAVHAAPAHVRRRHARAPAGSTASRRATCSAWPAPACRSRAIAQPWINPQHYGRDKKMFRNGAIDDGVMRCTRRSEPAALTRSAAATVDLTSGRPQAHAPPVTSHVCRRCR
ncbi:MAG: hypothetical protein WKF58_17730 [Ilumatobacteraceae bacterium]